MFDGFGGGGEDAVVIDLGEVEAGLGSGRAGETRLRRR